MILTALVGKYALVVANAYPHARLSAKRASSSDVGLVSCHLMHASAIWYRPHRGHLFTCGLLLHSVKGDLQLVERFVVLVRDCAGNYSGRLDLAVCQ